MVAVDEAQTAGRFADFCELLTDPELVKNLKHLVIEMHGARERVRLMMGIDDKGADSTLAEQTSQCQPCRAGAGDQDLDLRGQDHIHDAQRHPIANAAAPETSASRISTASSGSFFGSENRTLVTAAPS